jgi:cyclohexadienyl dehydratase
VIEWVRFRWPDLLNDLAEDRFDLAMSGVTVRPDRSLAGRFSVPVCETGAVLLIDRQGRAFASIPLAARDSLADLDRPAFRIAVNAGGHLERVTRRQFPHATVIAIPDNAAVLARVLDGKADAAVSDTQEAPGWSAKAPSLEIWGPFTRDRKAYLVRPELAELAFDLDDWLQAREADGRLAELRSAYLRGQQPALATGVPALVSGIAERLALMPMVAEAKRRSGQAIEVPLREERVIEAGIVKTREIALARGMTAPSPGAVREFYRAQIEAAKAIQRSVLAGPVTLTSPPDLSLELRPALIRIGDRLADLIVGLPMSARAARTSGSQILAQTRAALAPLGLDDAHVDAIASAIESISSTRSAPGGADAP